MPKVIHIASLTLNMSLKIKKDGCTPDLTLHPLNTKTMLTYKQYSFRYDLLLVTGRAKISPIPRYPDFNITLFV